MDDTEITKQRIPSVCRMGQRIPLPELFWPCVDDPDGMAMNSLIGETELDYELNRESPRHVFPRRYGFFKQKMDYASLKYKYEWVDWQKASHDPAVTRKIIDQKEEVKNIPDTLCWIRDFTYSYNEPQTRNYFWHPALMIIRL